MIWCFLRNFCDAHISASNVENCTKFLYKKRIIRNIIRSTCVDLVHCYASIFHNFWEIYIFAPVWWNYTKFFTKNVYHKVIYITKIYITLIQFESIQITMGNYWALILCIFSCINISSCIEWNHMIFNSRHTYHKK